MSVTKAQKFRLGLFLLVTTTLLVGTILLLVGSSLMEQRDSYYVLIEGSAGGLEKGAQVRYNGIRVGRVEAVDIDPEDPAMVRIELSLKEGTPVTEDTVAVLNMQGITGLKYIELSGGTKESVALEPGAEIPNGGSDFDLLTEKAFSITTKIEDLLDNLVAVTGGESIQRLNAVLAETEEVLKSVRALVDENRDELSAIVANAKTTTDEVKLAVTDARATIATLDKTITKIGNWVDSAQIRRVIKGVDLMVKEINKRVGPDELGALLASGKTLTDDTTTLVNNADVTLLRTRDDLRRALDELATSTENLTEFTQILVDNPSALISGRTEQDRALP